MRLGVIASLLLLTGCEMLGLEKPAPEPMPAPSGETVSITKQTWAAFENYKYWLTPKAWTKQMGEGYFAVAKDGRSWGLTGCTANECIAGKPISQAAVDICQTRSAGVPCIIFAKDQDIVVSYDIAE